MLVKNDIMLGHKPLITLFARFDEVVETSEAGERCAVLLLVEARAIDAAPYLATRPALVAG